MPAFVHLDERNNIQVNVPKINKMQFTQIVRIII